MRSPGGAPSLGATRHGKNRVRVAKVRRGARGTHTFVEYEVRIELEGGTARAFTHGDNRAVVSTDTCKNHVYMLAKRHACGSPERFALDLAASFLRQYGHVSAAQVRVAEKPWRRAEMADGALHQHGFVELADGTHSASVRCERRSTAPASVALTSKLGGLRVLKTTQSGWEKFVQDAYTTLPATRERILATSIDAEWQYERGAVDGGRVHFQRALRNVRDALLSEFFGPASTGHYSNGVQETLFKMGSRAIANESTLSSITLSLPNIHFLPCRLAVFAKNNIAFEDDVFVPTDEPHGIISATVDRGPRAKL